MKRKVKKHTLPPTQGGQITTKNKEKKATKMDITISKAKWVQIFNKKRITLQTKNQQKSTKFWIEKAVNH